MNVKRTILFLTAAALLTGCFKDVSTKTNYVIKPLVQDLSGDPYLALEGVKAYAFNADTTFYTVASYADALEGIDNHQHSFWVCAKKSLDLLHQPAMQFL